MTEPRYYPIFGDVLELTPAGALVDLLDKPQGEGLTLIPNPPAWMQPGTSFEGWGTLNECPVRVRDLKQIEIDPDEDYAAILRARATPAREIRF